LGYLSGVAIWVTNLAPLDGMDADGVWGWLDNRCRANPIEDFSDAVKAFVDAHPR
jgi:hypothetical protein